MEQDNYDQALNYAFRLLGFRMRTIKEITERLLKKGYQQATVQLVTARLQELGYLNDESYVESYIRSKVKPTGRRRFQYELLQKGINKDTVDNGLTTGLTAERELTEAQALAEKLWFVEQKRQLSKGNDPAENLLKRKILYKISQKLTARGFSTNIITKIMRQIGSDLVEND